MRAGKARAPLGDAIPMRAAAKPTRGGWSFLLRSFTELNPGSFVGYRTDDDVRGRLNIRRSSPEYFRAIGPWPGLVAGLFVAVEKGRGPGHFWGDVQGRGRGGHGVGERGPPPNLRGSGDDRSGSEIEGGGTPAISSTGNWVRPSGAPRRRQIYARQPRPRRREGHPRPSGKVGVAKAGVPLGDVRRRRRLGQPYAIVRGCRFKSEHRMWHCCA